MDLDLGPVVIQVIHLDPHRECIQTGVNDRMDLDLDLVVIPDLQQTQVVHQVISVEGIMVVAIPVAIQVAIQVVMVEITIRVAILVVVQGVVVVVAVIPAVIPVVILVAIQEDI